jgi:outer membrane protein assembly factor BamB
MKMRNKSLLFLVALPLCCWIAFGQSRGGNWPTFGGDALRSGWAGTETSLSKDNVKDMQLLWKLKLESEARGTRQVMPPVILSRLISYRGFKELAFTATNADIAYSIDADLGTIFWQKHLEYNARDPQATTSSWRCPGGLTAMPTMPVPAPRGGAGGRGAPPAAPAVPPATPGQRGSAFIGGPASLYTISSDGRLHRLNTSTGDDMTQPVSVIPANSRATSLTMIDNVIYTVTSHECSGATDAVWAIDLSVDPVKVRSFTLKGGTGWGLGGTAIGSDGTVYVRTGDSRVLALRPRELQLKGEFATGSDEPMPAVSPVVLPLDNRDFIVTDCGTSQLCLLDSTAMGSPIYKTVPIADSTRKESSGTWGSLTSWQEMDGTRWVLASVLGALHPDLKSTALNGPTPNGFIVAFKVQERDGKRILEPAWISRDLHSPVPPVVTNGVVFALSAGEFTRTATEERPKGSTRATLYALDARTGKELYSSKNLVTGPAALTGLTVSGGRVYFGGADGSLYAFGMYMEH